MRIDRGSDVTGTRWLRDRAHRPERRLTTAISADLSSHAGVVRDVSFRAQGLTASRILPACQAETGGSQQTRHPDPRTIGSYTDQQLCGPWPQPDQPDPFHSHAFIIAVPFAPFGRLFTACGAVEKRGLAPASVDGPHAVDMPAGACPPFSTAPHAVNIRPKNAKGTAIWKARAGQSPNCRGRAGLDIGLEHPASRRK